MQIDTDTVDALEATHANLQVTGASNQLCMTPECWSVPPAHLVVVCRVDNTVVRQREDLGHNRGVQRLA